MANVILDYRGYHMSLNSTPRAERIHIGIFGCRNAGKSSVINALTDQQISIVSPIKGTTTDPVSKAMELLPLGPVTIIDTPGLDDEGELGSLRIKKAIQVLNKTDIALLVADAVKGINDTDRYLIEQFKSRTIPYIIVLNKADLLLERRVLPDKQIYVSAVTKEGVYALKEQLAQQVHTDNPKMRIVGDLINPTDFIVLVVPIDKAAPKGRLILPQQQTIRDILEADATAIVVKEHELQETLFRLGKKPRLVITDSQVFKQVAAVTPDDIPLTSFSILFARYKGELSDLVRGVGTVDALADGDKVLISEGCSHHRQCDDIGTVKIPFWLKQHTGKDIIIETSSGVEFPEDLSPYKMVIHCGGCTLNSKEMTYRIASAKGQNIPIVNYGILIAYLQGILKRSVEIFPTIYKMLEK